jgi:hypothetical protein
MSKQREVNWAKETFAKNPTWWCINTDTRDSRLFIMLRYIPFRTRGNGLETGSK